MQLCNAQDLADAKDREITSLQHHDKRNSWSDGNLNRQFTESVMFDENRIGMFKRKADGYKTKI
jgi:hypothetical protein